MYPAPPFPDFDADIAPVQDLHELNVGPVREPPVVLDERAVAPGILRRRLVDEDNAVRVADRRCREFENFPVNVASLR